MPFTVSHIAAVLPVQSPLRRWGLFSAAVIGCMVPDFGFLMWWRHLERADTHSARALLTFCLPVGMATWWLFQLLIKPAWCAVLPGRWRRRLRAEHPAPRFLNGWAWLGAAVALLGGAVTHLVWDGFTHEDGRGVQMLPFLDDYVPNLPGHPLRLYRLLQDGSSVVGLIIVIVAAWRWTRGPVAAPRDDQATAAPDAELPAAERHFWIAAYLLIPVLTLLAATLPRLHFRLPWLGLEYLITPLAYRSLQSAAVSLVLVSTLVRARLAALGTRSLDG